MVAFPSWSAKEENPVVLFFLKTWKNNVFKGTVGSKESVMHSVFALVLWDRKLKQPSRQKCFFWGSQYSLTSKE